MRSVKMKMGMVTMLMMTVMNRWEIVTRFAEGASRGLPLQLPRTNWGRCVHERLSGR